jgi:hypothetical protein
MARLLKHLVLLTLLLSILGAGLAQAAQTTFGPVSEMVICSDGGAQLVRLDRQGKPIKQKSCCDCLDCLVLTADVGLSVCLALSQGLAWVPARFAIPAIRVGSLPRYARPMPRAPPTLAMKNNQNSSPIDMDQSKRAQAVQHNGQKPEAAR